MKKKFITLFTLGCLIANLYAPLSFAETVTPEQAAAPITQETPPENATGEQSKPAGETPTPQAVVPQEAAPQNPALGQGQQEGPVPKEEFCGTDTSNKAEELNNAVEPTTTENDEGGKKEEENRKREEDHRSESDQEIGNKAETVNNVWSGSNTGDNEAEGNAGNAEISTGDAETLANIINLINTQFVGLGESGIKFLFDNFYSDLLGDYTLDPNKGEDNLDLFRDVLKLVNSNDGSLTNNINLYANTGDNEAENNNGNAAINTGDANIGLNLFNMLNSTFIAEKGVMGVLNVFGDWLGDLVLPLSLFGNENGNDAKKQENELTVDNNASVNNNIGMYANTGDNETMRNGGSGLIDTGDSNAILNLANFVNQTYTGDIVYFVLVNVVGEWNGASLLPDWLKAIVLPNENGGTSILLTNMNNDNKDGATKNNVSADNKALITNNINLFANTGDNETEDNGGSGSIVTGDSTVLANIFNLANVTVTSKKMVFMVVNVFGDWFGNLVGDKKENENTETDGNKGRKETKVASVAKKVRKGVARVLAPWWNPKSAEQIEDTQEGVAGVLEELKASEPLADFNVNPQNFTEKFKESWLAKARPYLVVMLVIYLGFLSVYLRRDSIKKDRRHG